MSGGEWDYLQCRIRELAEQVEDSWNIYKKHACDPKPSDETKTLVHGTVVMARTLAIMTQRLDWLFSGDDGENDFHRRLKQEFNDLDVELKGLDDRL